MAMTLAALAERLGLPLAGSDREFTGLNTLEAASETEVSFLANPRYTHLLAGTRACAVILAREFAAQAPSATLVSANPYLDFARAAALFVRKQGEQTGLSPLACVHPTARLGEDCAVYPYVFIGPRARIGNRCTLFPGVYVGDDCVIGDDCVLYPHAVLMAGVEMGDRCILHSGSVLGTEGFGFTRAAGAVQKIPQIGAVVLGDGVDVGANTCIDRATLGATRVGRDTKIDNLVQLGHNVEVGEQCFLISQVGVAGSTRVGDRVTMAGQVGVAGHLRIGDDVTIGPQAGVPKDIPDGVSGSGTPFMERRTFMRNLVLQPKLADMHRRLQQLEKELSRLRESLGAGKDTP